jgi:outer membrane lipoprotein SlyB
MRSLTTSFVGAVLAVFTTSIGAMAQSYYDNQACRQYADSAVAPLRDQANSQAGAQALGSTLLGAGLGAAIGGAVGGGRGAGIGAASGAVLGGGAGVANAQNTAAYVQQQYNAYYAQCMASRRPAPPPYNYNAPAASYNPTPSYNAPPSNYYAPPPGYAPAPSYYSGYPPPR